MVSQKHKYCKNFLRNSHWRNLSMIMWWERYSNASPKPDFFLFSLFIFSFISQLIWIRLGWNFHRWFSIQERVNWCTINPLYLYFCTSQHSIPSNFNMSEKTVLHGLYVSNVVQFGDFGMLRVNLNHHHGNCGHSFHQNCK